jgi:hypothetical protein
VPLELRAAVGAYDEIAAQFTVYTSAGGGVIRQRDDIAGALGVAKDAVRVHRSGATTPTYHLTGVAPLSGMEQNRLKGV